MTQPVSYLEINSPDLDKTVGFFEAAFGWSPPSPSWRPTTSFAPHGEAPGIDTGIMASRDGAPRSVPIIRVPVLDAALARVTELGGTVVVEPFTITGVGQGCYVLDPAGVLLGLHCYQPEG